MLLHPRQLTGPWNQGMALDRHTVHSQYLGQNEFGRDQYETTRSEIGQELFLLKYRNDLSKVEILGKAIKYCVNKYWADARFDFVIPMPASVQQRSFQPVAAIARAAASSLTLPCHEELLKKRTRESLKDINEKAEKEEKLKGALELSDPSLVRNARILLIDDIYDTGATAEATTKILLDAGAASVYLMTI